MNLALRAISSTNPAMQQLLLVLELQLHEGEESSHSCNQKRPNIIESKYLAKYNKDDMNILADFEPWNPE